MNTEHAERKRDLRLRRLILRLMHAARVGPASGWMSGRFVVDVIEMPKRIYTDVLYLARKAPTKP